MAEDIQSPQGLSADLIERVARAICDEEWAGTQPPFDRKPASFGGRYRAYARAALNAARSASPAPDPKGKAQGTSLTEAVTERDGSFVNLTWIVRGREHRLRIYEPHLMGLSPALADLLVAAAEAARAPAPAKAGEREQVAEAVERLKRLACGFPAHINREGVGTVSARWDDLNTVLPALAEARSEVERLNKVASNDMTALDLMTGWNEANKRIRSLLAERDTLAAQLVGAREALESVQTIAASGAEQPASADHLRRTVMAMSSTAALAAHRIRVFQALSMSILRGDKGEASGDQVARPQTEADVAVKPSGRETYRGWIISYDPPPIPVRSCDWQFWHEDYDGPEDSRSGHAGSLDEAKAEIDMREDD